MDLVEKIKIKARQEFKKIVLPESYEERTLKAADIVISDKLAQIVLIGEKEKIEIDASRLGLNNISKATIINPYSNKNKEKYVDLMVKLRAHKGLTRDEAFKLVEDPLVLATLMIKNGDVDGELAGADNSTGDVLRPAFQFVGTKPGISVVSGAFIMILKDKEFGEDGMLVFADCAVNPNPDEQQLAEIAISTAHTTKAIAGFDPRVAMLSFSTKGSAKHELVDKVVNATLIAQKADPSLDIDGELQLDAALVESVGLKKCPESKIAGKANVLIFPDLQAGNIAYKMAERLAHATAFGPVLQGMAAPINDLSRGCTIDNIVNMVAVTALQAAGLDK
ncbi:MAG: phosphate acetyltransferase [Bacteroidota bacterium]|nr:phosphate acetyltransferase [Bacteroidota bacterium]